MTTIKNASYTASCGAGGALLGSARRLYYGKRRLCQFALGIPRKRIVVADDDSVAHFNESIRKGNQFGIVCNQNNGLLESPIQFPKHVQNDFRIFGVQTPRWLIREHDGGFAC